MQSENYRETIKDALKNLVAVNGQIFNSIVPVAMLGELKDWNDSVPVGEEYQFSFDLFKNCEDTNIQLLVQLVEKVEEIFQTMVNINNINLDEEEISS